MLPIMVLESSSVVQVCHPRSTVRQHSLIPNLIGYDWLLRTLSTYVLVVNDHTLLAGGLVGARMLMDAPITPPTAGHTATAPGEGEGGGE